MDTPAAAPTQPPSSAPQSALVRYHAARRALAEAHRVDDAATAVAADEDVAPASLLRAAQARYNTLYVLPLPPRLQHGGDCAPTRERSRKNDGGIRFRCVHRDEGFRKLRRRSHLHDPKFHSK